MSRSNPVKNWYKITIVFLLTAEIRIKGVRQKVLLAIEWIALFLTTIETTIGTRATTFLQTTSTVESKTTLSHPGENGLIQT